MKKWGIVITIIVLVIALVLIFQIPKKGSIVSNIACFKNVNVSLEGNRGNITGNICYYTNLSSRRCNGFDDCSGVGICQFPLAYENSTSEIMNFAKVGVSSSIIAEDVSGFCISSPHETGLYLMVNNGKARFQYLAVD